MKKLHGDLRDYRQPLVTSLGIVLGFLLNFLAGWANGADGTIEDATDVVILTTIMTAALLFLIVLARILRADLPEDKDYLGKYYAKTLFLYLTGLCVAFAGLGAAFFF